VNVLLPPECINLAGVDTGRDHLSPSSLGTQLACLERYRWHYEDRLAPAVKKASLSTGSAFAQALERGDPDHAWTVTMAEQAIHVERAAASPWVIAPTQETAEIQAQIAREAARAYLARYGQHQQTREVECKARMRNPATGAYSRTFDVMCIVDALADDNGEIIEDKLVGEIPRKDADFLLKLDRQVGIETYLVWRTTGVNPRVRYRWTLKPAIRRRQSETHDEYLVRIAFEYATRPDHYLAEGTPSRSPQDFLRLEAELWQYADQLRAARRAGVWPRNPASCRDYGGCAFLPLCSGEPGARTQFVVRAKREKKEAVPV
jgi:hypothetical protein